MKKYRRVDKNTVDRIVTQIKRPAVYLVVRLHNRMCIVSQYTIRSMKAISTFSESSGSHSDGSFPESDNYCHWCPVLVLVPNIELYSPWPSPRFSRSSVVST